MLKGLEDNVSAVRDSFAEALGSLLALAVNPDAQVCEIYIFPNCFLPVYLYMIALIGKERSEKAKHFWKEI
jgi:hypothetical protein